MQSRSSRAAYAVIPVLCCAALTLGNLSLNLFAFPEYADYSWVTKFITNDTSEPRWLIHIKLQAAIHHTLASMYFVRGYLPVFVRDPLNTARALNVLFLVAAALHCYAFHPRVRHTVVWVITSAAYCFMATGYAKVYGAATALLLLLYCFLADTEFESDGFTLGVVSAVVGLYYLALLPISMAILLTLLIKRTNTFLPALLGFVLAGYALIAIFWGQSVQSFFGALWSESHFGNRYTAYVPYRGQAASAHSIFFKTSFVLSAKHLGDKLYMLFFSGALVSFGGACYEVARLVFQRKLTRVLRDLKPMPTFCCVSFAAYVTMLIGYLSKIGPRGDLAFYSPFVVPFTFVWFQLRNLRTGGEGSAGSLLIAQYLYTAVIVIWSGVVGPPDI